MQDSTYKKIIQNFDTVDFSETDGDDVKLLCDIYINDNPHKNEFVERLKASRMSGWAKELILRYIK